MHTNKTIADRRKKGLCKCGKKPEDPAYVNCLSCRLKLRKNFKDYGVKNPKSLKDTYDKKLEKYRKNREAGLCWCGNKRVPGYKQCKKHRWNGGKKLPKYVTGEPCAPRPPYSKPLKHGGLSRTEVRRKWAAEGLCYYCGQEKMDKHYCQRCRDTVNRFHESAKKARQAAREEDER